jgi:hypothetical protein
MGNPPSNPVPPPQADGAIAASRLVIRAMDEQVPAFFSGPAVVEIAIAPRTLERFADMVADAVTKKRRLRFW